jgi:Right handed beta helix region
MSRAAPRHIILQLAALALGTSVGCAAQGDATVTLMPGQDIQEIVEASPEGTRFYFSPGTYHRQTIVPKDRQEFIGQDAVILSGAMELTSWKEEDGIWSAGGLPPPLDSHGSCHEGRELCALPEDLFFNNRVFERVGSLGALRPGTWFYDNGRAYLTDDPTGQLVELGVTPLAFGGSAADVVLTDLIVEKYASKAQKGALHLNDTRGWKLSNVTARWNHGVGLYVGSGMQVKGGSFSHNGQLGMGGGGEGSTIEGVEIAFNNYAGFRQGWEAGGTKFSRAKALVVRDSCVHHNVGPGLWTDINNIHVVYEGNKVFANLNDGIKHEISYDAIIRNNFAAFNGREHDVWLWGSQILIQNSRNVEVYGNVVEVSPEFGNGIGVVHQNRGEPGDGTYGPWDSLNNYVHHNTVVYFGDRGRSGVVMDTEEKWFWDEANNRFDWNQYVITDEEYEYWRYNDQDWSARTVEEVTEALGYERNGSVSIERRTPTELSCNR